MGIPYSRQINAAFDQVTPLVAAGFRVLQTTKNISILLAIIQVLTVVLLAFNLVAMFGILISINPQLEAERDELVTPSLIRKGGCTGDSVTLLAGNRHFGSDINMTSAHAAGHLIQLANAPAAVELPCCRLKIRICCLGGVGYCPDGYQTRSTNPGQATRHSIGFHTEGQL